MTSEKPKSATCPNCQEPAVRTGDEITCEICDATFTITKKAGVKVKEMGPMQSIRDRLARLEATILDEPPAEPDQTELSPGSENNHATPAVQPDNGSGIPTEQDQDDEILPR